jgi:integrase
MTSKRASHKNEKYQNLYSYPDQPCWIFRKYSSEKRKSFYCSTGLDKTDRNAAAAYRIGSEKFVEWLGAFLPSDGVIHMRDLARAVLATKEDPSISDATYRSVRNQIDNHIIPACGHMKAIHITTEWWRNYQREDRKRPRELLLKDGTVKELPPRTKLFNTKKVMVEILKLAKERGLIEKIPDLPLNDAEAAPPRYIPKEDIMKIIRFAGRIAGHPHKGGWAKESRYHKVLLKLLVFIMWKQGARPHEVLQYRWSMIRWREGPHGSIDIPAEITKTRRARTIPLNSKVSRVLKFLHGNKESEWIFPSPKVAGEHVKDYSSAWDSTMNRLGLDFDIYNIRDTYITDRLKSGHSATFIAKYVDNSAAMIERRYAVAESNIMQGVAG